MHGSALALAIPSFFAQQLGEHAVWRRPFRQAVSVAAMRAGNVIVAPQRLTNSYCYGFFADVKVGQPWHQCARVKFVDLLFEQPDRDHLPVHADPLRGFDSRIRRRFVSCSRHFEIPDIRANTSNTTAKSSLAIPMPRAAVRNSLLTAVVGRGTSRCRPNSIASSISFCIMFTSNQASSGCCRTNGPRY